MKFCIVGTGRCGTTLLWRILNAHPDLFAFKESHWFPALFEAFAEQKKHYTEYLKFIKAAKFVDGSSIFQKNLDRHSISVEDLIQLMEARFGADDRITALAFADAFGEACAQLSGKSIWGDKTPSYGFHLESLHRQWPTCKFIHIVRNGAACALSMASHQGYKMLLGSEEIDYSKLAFSMDGRQTKQPPSSPSGHDPHEFIQLWERLLTPIRLQSELLEPNIYMEVRYEDLLSAPQAVLERVLAFLQVPASAGWLVRVTKEVEPRRPPVSYDKNVLQSAAPAALQTLEDYGYQPDGVTTPVPPNAPSAIAAAVTARAAISKAVDRDLLADGTLQRLDENCIDDIRAEEILLFCPSRNEVSRLPYFLEYYRKLGVSRFFMIDNKSTDETREFLLEQKDVHYFYTEQSYLEAHRARLWMQALRQAYGVNQWCITVDVDEMLVFPMCEHVSLQALTAYMDETKAEALFTIMLDMYGDDLENVDYVSGAPFADFSPFFDKRPYWASITDQFPHLSMFGGVRHRCFFKENDQSGPAFRNGGPVLRKLPLVKWSADKTYINSTHSLTPCKLADVTGALLHYKMLGNFKEFARQEMRSGERPPGEYETYFNALESGEGYSLICEHTERFVSSSQLVNLSLMRASKPYMNTMVEALRDVVGKKRAAEVWAEHKNASLISQTEFQPELGHMLNSWPLLERLSS